MMKFIARVVFTVSIILLTSCIHKLITPQAKDSYASCKASCEQRSRACNKVCRNNCQQCNAYSWQKAKNGYYNYRHEETVNGGFIARELKSYRDPLQCRKTTCDCRGDYQVCMQSCGGVIKKRLQVAPVCK